MPRLRMSALAAGVLAASLGCSMDSGLGLSWDCCGMGGGGPTTTFVTLPYIENFLSGDTTRVALSGAADARSTWEIDGPAVFVLGEDSVTTRVTTAVPEVLIRGSGTGAVTLKARHELTGVTLISIFYVAHRSAVTLRLAQSDVALPLGTDRWLDANLQDAADRRYRARLTWSSSDTTVVALLDPPNASQQSTIVRGRAVGTAHVIAAGLGHRDSARVMVH